MNALPSMPTTVQVKSCCGLMINEPCDCASTQVYVYVVCTGETDEGSSPVAVISTLPRALEWVNETYGVIPGQTEHRGVWMAEHADRLEVWVFRMAVR